MSSAMYSSSPMHWSRWSPTILARPQSRQASLAASPSQWRCTPQKTCPLVMQKWAIVWALSRCLEIGTTVARITHGFPKLFVFGSWQYTCQCMWR
ncbi:uncharacterized protein TNCV_255081 [Trichonephila clavipes]|nr:uncharacterized protein TNCV_255081 [Trichonephila clavipes]